MKEKILDVLWYLVESFFNERGGSNSQVKLVSLAELEDAGFEPELIHDTINWLQANLQQVTKPEPITIQSQGFRFYTDYEASRLTPEARGFLTILEKSEAIDVNMRELIIDYAICSEVEVIDIDMLEKIVFFVMLMQTRAGLDKATLLAIIDNYGSNKQKMH